MIALRPSACLLRLVSWLLVAFIPGLLMLATFGLDRLEASLDGDAVSPADVAAVLEQAKADCAKPAAPARDRRLTNLLDDSVSTRYPEPFIADRPLRQVCRHGSSSTTDPIPNFSRLATPIVCSVGTSRSGLRLD